MELDTVNAYNTVGMEQGLSGDPWDCLFGSDSISDAFLQGRPEMFHMGIRRCDNTSQFGWFGPGLGFDFDDVLTEADDDPICFNDKSSNSNLEELNLDSDSELALTLDPNLILPHNMSICPATNSDAAMMETASVEENAENEGEETENESEVERTENDEENESEDEEEIENEENEHSETEYETVEEETEEEEEEEDEETEDDEPDTTLQQPLTPLSVEAPTSMSSSSVNIGARTLTASTIASSPTIQLTRLHHPKISTISGTVKVQDIKLLAANSGNQVALQQIRKQMSYNNNVHDVSTGATTTLMIQAAKREKDLTTGNRDNSYPKPAYSYSCLIAMALKNSRTGSLPVSEIYNFMCRHFPYFTTAPTGWKNSVRHNLSLNKCFEKIEKPPGNGSQRKGCLWAIHPSKVAKMDEEVRKWSRKDPTAIKRAMVNPDQLELLERGEMKYEGDRHEETYEDAESYADSETGGSAVDEPINDDENVTYDETKQVDIVDDEIVVEQLYEDLDLDTTELLDTRLNDFPRQERPLVYEFVSCAKRQKTLSGSPLQNDYVYQQVNAASPRKKAHLVALRAGGTAPGAGSLLEPE
ncbi:uncharacterized protein Jumu [Temnothorax longispinosus]|uniref:Forkhead box protein N4 n=1 Tax=Temnothorax longispinosus TaxID=300112 RepID=A0A4S2KAK4_9HYME|nr:Forkhead box protein N4 [Temnothorax longispinosus]